LFFYNDFGFILQAHANSCSFLNTRLSNAAEIDSVYSALRQQAVFCDSDVVITKQVHQVATRAITLVY